MEPRQQEKRRYKRHRTLRQKDYDFAYSVETRMECEIEDEKKNPDHSKFNAYTQNLSAEGMCFVSEQKLTKGTPVHLSLFLPDCDEMVDMEGHVKWSLEKQAEQDHKKIFATGIQLDEVNGQLVSESIHYDELFRLQWSVVLESVFGRYRLFIDQKKKKTE
jgi:Tfp pilus assembly protein PilZ